MVNKITLIGNLGRDAEHKTLDSGAQMSNFSLATSESYKDKNGEWQSKTEWHDIVVWGNNAERASRLVKGQMVYVEGKVTYQKYTDKSGVEKWATRIVANYFRSLEKSGGSSQGGLDSFHAVSTPSTPIGGDDDLPF